VVFVFRRNIDEGKIGTLKLMGADHTERCIIHLGLGQGDTDYLHIQKYGSLRNILFKAFAQAGFARKFQDENKLLLLPCPLGTFVDSLVSDPEKLECLNCSAGNNILNHQRHLNTKIKNRLYRHILHFLPCCCCLRCFRCCSDFVLVL